jgi:tetratricopeptide (TPR) repeat protein
MAWALVLSFASTAASAEETSLQQWLNLPANDPASAFSRASEMLLTTDSATSPAIHAQAHDVLGELFYHRGAYQQALQHLITSHTIWERLGEVQNTAHSLLLLGLVYYYTKQTELAYDTYEEARQLYQSINDRKGLGRAYSLLGHLAEKRLAFEHAIELQEKALAFFTEINDADGEAEVYENLGSIFEDLAHFEQSERYFAKALALNWQTGSLSKAIVNLNNLGDIYRKTRQFNKAEYYSKQALRLADSLGQRYQVQSALKDLAKLAYDLGNYREAFHLLDSHRHVYTELYNEESSLQTRLLQTMYETRQKDNKITELMVARRKNGILFILLGLLAFLLAISIYLVLNRKRIRLEKNNLLLEQQQHLVQNEKLLTLAELENMKLNESQLEAELKINKLHEELLNKELDTRSRELTTHTLQIIRKNRLLGDLKEKLVHLSKANTAEQNQILRDLSKRIDLNLVQEKEWTSFNKSFEEVHQRFYELLHARHPDLSQTEIRLCALIKLNMNSRDIATILGISADSLRVARYRLKKKLNLEADDKLTAYIHAVAEA